MKKIAVQTQPPVTNYGGILQAFALQKVLKNLGHEVVLLNTIGAKKRSFIQNWKFKLWLYTSKEGKEKRAEILFKEKVAKDFKINFINKYIKLSHPLYNSQEWVDYISKNKFDILVAGSDQVWRLEYNQKYRKESFLDYNLSPVKKISYAASLGVAEIDEELKGCLLKFLPSFSAISVREMDSVSLLAGLGLKAQVCLDPTLLLTEKNYVDYLGLKKIEDKFIFAYLLDYDNKNYNLEQFLSDPDTKIKIEKDLTTTTEINKTIKKAGVIDWLQYIYSAQYVLTDSFHGMVFSIIFKKQFYIKINYERGASRFVSLLTQLNLMDRIWDGSKIEKKEIDYYKVYAKLDKLKVASIEFLKENLK